MVNEMGVGGWTQRESLGSDMVGSQEVRETKVEQTCKLEQGKADMVVSWWNGGGKLIPRIRTNPELNKFLATEPDIFVYGEAQIYNCQQNTRVPGYKVYMHTAKRNNLRRGLAVYYREEHANV